MGVVDPFSTGRDNGVKALIDLSLPKCHPNLLCYIDYFILNNHPVILTDYIHGDTLDYIHDLTIQQIEFIFLELLNILSYIHSKGYVHGDINLSNIIITKQNQIKLIDFGFAQKYYKQNQMTKDLYELAACIEKKLNESPSYCIRKIFKAIGYTNEKLFDLVLKYTISANEAYDLMIECMTNKIQISL